jgi:hypothetical protein
MKEKEMESKILISEKDFNEKVIGWLERRTHVNSDNLIQLLKGLTTTVSVCGNAEDSKVIIIRKDLLENQDINFLLRNAVQILIEDGHAKEQSILSDVKSKDAGFIHHCGNPVTEKELFHDHCLKCGESFSDDGAE